MTALTPRQHKARDFIESYINRNGYAPSFREIGAGLGIRSTGAVSTLLERLRDRGVIAYAPDRRRDIRLVENDHAALHYASDSALMAEVKRRGLA